MERKSRARLESWAFVALVLMIMVAANVVALKALRRARWDLTKRGQYSLSNGTRRTLGRLQDQLSITAYWTADQPAPANDDERLLREQLDEYVAVGNDHVAVRIVHPDNDERRRAAEGAGCPEITMQAVDVREQQATARRVYRCITFEYLRNREKIERVEVGMEGMEYQVTSIIKKMIDPERPFGFLTGHDEATVEQNLRYLPQYMQDRHLAYTTRAVDLHGGDQAVPTDIKGLIIMNPTRRIEERELRRINEYLMRGGAVAIFASGVNVTGDDARPTATRAEHNLNQLLNGYGLTLNSDVVLDPRSGDAIVRLEGQVARIKVLTFPVLAGDGLDQSHPTVFRLPLIFTPYVSTLNVDRGRATAHGTRLAIIGRSSEDSIVQRENYELDVLELNMRARQLFRSGGAHGPYNVAVALEGQLRSAFEGSAPAAPAGDAGVSAPPSTDVPSHATRERPARLLVVGSGKLFNFEQLSAIARIQGGDPTNIQMLLDTFDWLSADPDLLAVRAKNVSEPEIRANISDTKKLLFQWGSIVGLPLLVGVVGVALASVRARRRAALKL